jgi:2-polyprenyl-6-methoxyphenol hydroxylase-like FAD-dependent oxidoreductase
MTNDVIIIGTGQAGPFLAQRLAGAEMKVAIIEHKLLGGTCVNTGCILTKAMVASAYAAHMVCRAADFGGPRSPVGWFGSVRRRSALARGYSAECWCHRQKCTHRFDAEHRSQAALLRARQSIREWRKKATRVVQQSGGET